MAKHLYIIAGCNDAEKTTASMTILPKSLLVKEFVNADEIAKGLSPFNPEGVAIEAGRLMLERILRRYSKGIDNLFKLFMKEVDIWAIYDNSEYKRERIAFGVKMTQLKINDINKFEIIKSYVK